MARPRTLAPAPPRKRRLVNLGRGRTATLREAFPDIRFPIDDLIAEDDKVVARWTATGTNDGEFMGIEPTGREVTIAGMTILRIRDGRIVEGWTNMDALGLLRQIGAVPEPARR